MSDVKKTSENESNRQPFDLQSPKPAPQTKPIEKPGQIRDWASI